MTLGETLRRAARQLEHLGSDEANLESELLLAHALNTDRTHLYQRLREEIEPEAERSFEALLRRRLAHEPAAYILGRREFYGLEFEVTPAAIIPRAETEILVEAVLEFARAPQSRTLSIVEVGVGSGVIVVSLAKQLSGAELIAIDASSDALDLARRNAERHGVRDRIRFLEGDLLDPLNAPVDVIVANLPYVRSEEFKAAPPEIRNHEPRLGLDGGPDGLRLIDRLLEQSPSRLRPGGALFAEIGEDQGDEALGLARRSFPQADVEVRKDLSHLDRVLVALT